MESDLTSEEGVLPLEVKNQRFLSVLTVDFIVK